MNPKKAIALAKGSLENYFDKFVGNDSPFIKADQFDSSSNSAASSGDLPGLVSLLEPAIKPEKLQFQTASTASLAKFKFLNENHHWDLNKQGQSGRTVLWIATQKSKHSLIRFDYNLRFDSKTNFRYLLSKNVELDTSDENGITPLAKSVLIGDQRTVQMLLSKGADTNIGTTDLETLNY